jgi:hypothetical protein
LMFLHDRRVVDKTDHLIRFDVGYLFRKFNQTLRLSERRQ